MHSVDADQRGLRARPKGNRRPLAYAINHTGDEQVTEVIEEFDRACAQTGRDWGKRNIHRAGVARSNGTGACIAAGQREVKAGCTLCDDLGRSKRSRRRDVVNERESIAAR